MDDERALLVDAFVADTADNLERMEAALLALDAHLEDPARIGEVFRAVHSIKGDASIVGLARLASLLHGVEDLLDRLRAGTLAPTRAIVSDLLGCVDALRVLVPAALRDEDRLTAAQAALFARLAALAGHDRRAVGAIVPDAPATASSGDGGPRLLRIELGKLDALLTVSGEIAILRRRLRALLADKAAAELQDEIDRLSSELQDEIMRARMVPVGPIFRPYARIVRDLGATLAKEVQLTVEGGDAGIDAALIAPVREALTHIVRNAIDHGIEPPAERAARGKPPAGHIVLAARHETGSFVVEARDDGAGFRRARIRERARQRGLDADRLSDGELLRLVLEPGFSTAERVTDLSGRGVGLDVVRAQLAALRGELTLASEEGRGATVTMRLPLTLALIDGFYVGVGAQTFVIPLGAVHECIELPDGAGAASGLVSFRGQPLPYLGLRAHLGVGGAPAARQSVVVVRHEGLVAGLAVDALHGEAQTVVKPLGPLFAALPSISGSTITADGNVALILDVPALLRDAVSRQPPAPV
ncbi:MAG TPA: chemotaxis protein CheW [Polyangia bacterium]|jgi:two-component system chemotaxis sensor kinase CheA